MFIIFVFFVGLLSASTVFPNSSRKTQHKEENCTIKSKFTNSLAQDSLGPPRVVEYLCSNQGEQEFVTKDGQQHTFHKEAASVRRCDAEKIWEVVEDGAKVPDAATFYFDATGKLLDICQRLFWRSGCKRFEHVLCEHRNYCEE